MKPCVKRLKKKERNKGRGEKLKEEKTGKFFVVEWWSLGRASILGLTTPWEPGLEGYLSRAGLPMEEAPVDKRLGSPTGPGMFSAPAQKRTVRKGQCWRPPRLTSQKPRTSLSPVNWAPVARSLP